MHRCPVAILLLLLSVVVVATQAAASPRIAGGQDARPGQFPHQVVVYYMGYLLGSGSIISPRWVLTSYTNMYFLDLLPYIIRAGVLRPDDRGQDLEVLQTYQPTAYEGYPHYIHDISVVHLRGAFVFNANVKPIAYKGPVVVGHEKAVFSGWGEFKHDGPSPKTLQFFDTTTITNAECKKLMGPYSAVVLEDSMCTYYGDAGHYDCYGDGGGPLLINGVLAGISSGRDGMCEPQYPVLYARLTYYVEWIDETIRNNSVVDVGL